MTRKSSFGIFASMLSQSPRTQTVWTLCLHVAMAIGVLSLLLFAPMKAGADPLENYLTADDFAKLFPNANGKIPVGADPIFFSYANMKDGLQMSDKFSPFLGEGDDTAKRLELAAILANWAQETTGGWDDAQDGYTSWGMYFVEENGARGTSLCYYDKDSPYQPDKPPSGDTCFFGRGPIQLSWNGNYGAFSEFLYSDPKILLNNPDQLLKEGKNGFASGYWFWVLYKGSPNVRDTSCHEAMIKDGPEGFGTVINIVNGGIECNHELYAWDEPDDVKRSLGRKIRHRADHFHHFADYLGVGGELPARPEGKPAGTPEWDDYYRKMLVGCITQ